jgi:GNAT superfamily N-acetyltransferase
MLEASLLTVLNSTREPSPLFFRRAELDSELVALCRTCSGYRKRFTSYEDAKEWSESLAFERDADPERALVLVSRQGENVALLELVIAEDALMIALLLVDKRARFSGVGRLCVSAVERAASALGYKALSLGVHLANTDAHAFWERLGFADSGFLGRGEEAILQMERLTCAALSQGAANVNVRGVSEEAAF